MPVTRCGAAVVGAELAVFPLATATISENATSTLFHELSHVITRISAEDRSDWIAEGLAEFYSVELVGAPAA